MRAEKQLLLDEIKEKIDSSNAMIVTRYEKFGSDVAWDFRSKIRGKGADIEIVKKRIFLKAAERSGLTFDRNELKGHLGIIFIRDDLLEAIKTLYNFSQDNEGVFEVLCGRFEGKDYSAEDIKTLSKLPGFNEMRAQFLGLLEAPMSQTLSVMESILTSIMYCLENKSKAS